MRLPRYNFRSFLSFDLEASEKWITVHPNGRREKGVPVLVTGEKGDYTVKAGAGGKLTGKKLSEVTSAGKAAAAAKPKESPAEQPKAERPKSAPAPAAKKFSETEINEMASNMAKAGTAPGKSESESVEAYKELINSAVKQGSTESVVMLHEFAKKKIAEKAREEAKSPASSVNNIVEAAASKIDKPKTALQSWIKDGPDGLKEFWKNKIESTGSSSLKEAYEKSPGPGKVEKIIKSVLTGESSVEDHPQHMGVLMWAKELANKPSTAPEYTPSPPIEFVPAQAQPKPKPALPKKITSPLFQEYKERISSAVRVDSQMSLTYSHMLDLGNHIPSAKEITWGRMPSSIKSAVEVYTNGHYKAMNDVLREKSKGSAKDKKNIKALEQAFQLPEAKATKDFITHRSFNLPEEVLNQLSSSLAEGKPAQFSQKGFISTTFRKSFADNWGGNTKMEILVKKDTPALSVKHVSSHPHEDEVILNHGQSFEVLEIVMQGNTRVLRVATV